MFVPGSGFTRPGLRINNSIPTGETSHKPGSARHGIPVADPFQDRDLLQPQGVLTLAPIATRCEALEKVPNKHEVCDHNNENKTGIFPCPCHRDR